jgi:hypothetical protein
MIPAELQAIFHSAHCLLKPRTPAPEISVEFFPFAGLTNTARVRDNRLQVRVSDLLEDAPESVLRALALILLARLYRKHVDGPHHDAYRGFIVQDRIQDRVRRSRLERGRRPTPHAPQGRWQNLEERFHRLNARYFGGALDRPALAWSGSRSRRTLGRYDSTHRVIVISRIFDTPQTPDCVIDYVLYHEMLHAKHPSRAEDCRWVSHPREFRVDERRFEGYREATKWLRNL